MPDVHAILIASSSKQWLHCPPSVSLQENFPNERSVYAEEGTFANEVCEYKVRKYLHERVKRPQSLEYDTEEIEQIFADFIFTDLMNECTLGGMHRRFIWKAFRQANRRRTVKPLF